MAGLDGLAHQRPFKRPPSRLSETPVMSLDRSEHRNTVPFASSSGLATRPSEFFLAASFLASSSLFAFSSFLRPSALRTHRSVATQPGHMAFTSTLSSPNSSDSDLVKLSKALLVIALPNM